MLGGPHAASRAALIEWIEHGTFDGTSSGRFGGSDGGVVRAEP